MNDEYAIHSLIASVLRYKQLDFPQLAKIIDIDNATLQLDIANDAITAKLFLSMLDNLNVSIKLIDSESNIEIPLKTTDDLLADAMEKL